MRFAIFTARSDFLNDRIFAPDLQGDEARSAMKWAALRDHAARAGAEIHTYDLFAEGDRPNAVIVDGGVKRGAFSYLARTRTSPKRAVVVQFEPFLVEPRSWRWMRLSSPFWGRVMVWHSSLGRSGKRFVHQPLPSPITDEDRSTYSGRRDRPRTKLATMIHSNKTSNLKGEFYSFRRELISHFEQHARNEFDLFGYGWNDEKAGAPFWTDTYRGIAGSRPDTYADYHFALAIENVDVCGYIANELFLSLVAGTVPVYLGASDVADYVPYDCFVDYRKFGSIADLVAYMQETAGTSEWEAYRDRGWEFLNSNAFEPFTLERFAQNAFEALKSVAR